MTTAFTKLISKADKLASQNKLDKALTLYRQALEIDDTTIELYDKLIATHKQIKKDWTDEDFSLSLSWSMKRQELIDPKFKRIHAQMEPEYKEVTQLIQKMIRAKTDKTETKVIEQITQHNQAALYPLIETILSFKEFQNKVFKKK